MISFRRFPIIIPVVIVSVLAAALPALTQDGARPPGTGPQPAQSAREEAYRANNIGVAYLEQYKYKEGAEEFRRALKIDPALSIARINLGIALYNVPDPAGSLRESKAAAEAAPGRPQPHYILGLIARAQNRTADAVAAFQRVLQIDPRDVGANVNLGQLYMQERKYEEAIKLFRVAIAAEPYNVTAAYNLAIALLRSNQREEGQRMMQQFQTLRASNYGTVIGQNYMEQGQYAEAIASTGAEAELVDNGTPEVTFSDATASLLPAKTGAKPTGDSPAFPQARTRAPQVPALERTIAVGELNDLAKRNIAATLGGGVALIDYDSDGDLDLYEVGPRSQSLYRNDGGKFVDVTEQSLLPPPPANAVGVGAVAGDYDNDGKVDLFVLRYGGNALYHNEGNGKFTDATSVAELPAYPYLSVSAALVDVDHDGDLDIFVAGLADLAKPAGGDATKPVTFPNDFAGAPNLLLRNNGNGKFTDVTAAAKVAASGGHAVAVVPTDYDNRRDVDLLVVNYGEAPVLFGNLRDGTFRDVAADVGIQTKGRFVCAAAADVNKDGYTDFFFGSEEDPGVFAISDGRGRFNTTAAPAGSESASAAQFIDYDNDGLLDLVTLSNGGARVLRNLGRTWVSVGERAVARELASAESSQTVPSPRAFASSDVDGDGDTDLIVRLASGDFKLARNDGGNRNASVRVQLVGRVSNRSGTGTKIEARAGSLSQKLEAYATSPALAPSEIIFGIGKRAKVDAIRLLWPSGNVQAEIDIAQSTLRAGETKPSQPVARSVTINEVDRKPSSCPYLYTWNGERFQFITDFMGGGEMGYWMAPGVRNIPDPDEYVRIQGDQLKERDGRYEIRVTNELEEVLYVDRLQLIAVAHPGDTEVYPNEGLIDPPRPPFKLHTARGLRSPIAATDGEGRDVLSKITKLDRRYPDDFKLHRIRGYAEEHTLTVDTGAGDSSRVLLLLTGWTDYAFSSDNVAAQQAGLSMMPPALQVKDANGQWQTVIADIGIPVGRPQTIAIDLTGKFLSTSREVRVVTNMRIYWDQILVDTSQGDAPVTMTRLDPLAASLRWRGFSAEVTPDGREPFGYDYDRVSPASPWKVMAGRYTREGDVRPLLLASDDMFVISLPGDEISLSFDATRLPLLPKGWKRTFLLYADGFSKEMDINSASPDHVMPLPFHGMKSYPYSAPEAYPATRAHRDYMERYNTRVIAAPLPPIEATFADFIASPGGAKEDDIQR